MVIRVNGSQAYAPDPNATNHNSFLVLSAND